MKTSSQGAVLHRDALRLTATGVAILAALLPVCLGLYGTLVGQPGDWGIYRAATLSWLGGGPFYHPEQVAGPYVIGNDAVLYPPVALPLFVAFAYLPGWAFVLPPVALTAWAIWHLRPSLLGWIVVAVCLNLGPTYWAIALGNPILWVVAAMALATRWPSLAVLVLLKPSLFPFALIGIRRRTWWVGLVVLVLVSLPFGAMWLDYAKVLLNARHPLGLLYNLGQAPTMLLPVAAWLGSGRRHGAETVLTSGS